MYGDGVLVGPTKREKVIKEIHVAKEKGHRPKGLRMESENGTQERTSWGQAGFMKGS